MMKRPAAMKVEYLSAAAGLNFSSTLIEKTPTSEAMKPIKATVIGNNISVELLPSCAICEPATAVAPRAIVAMMEPT